MNHTVIHRSGYIESKWKRYATYESASDAAFIASSITSPRVPSPFHRIKIMTHEESVSSMADYDNHVIRFKDGTVATI